MCPGTSPFLKQRAVALDISVCKRERVTVVFGRRKIVLQQYRNALHDKILNVWSFHQLYFFHPLSELHLFSITVILVWHCSVVWTNKYSFFFKKMCLMAFYHGLRCFTGISASLPWTWLQKHLYRFNGEQFTCKWKNIVLFALLV